MPSVGRWIPSALTTYIDSDSFVLITKLFLTMLVGGALYILGTLHVLSFFFFTVLLPLGLFLVDLATKKVFIEEFTNITILVRVKYFTFLVQNTAICAMAQWGNDSAMSVLFTWILRVNILEVFVDLIQHRRYTYFVPSLMLLLPITNLMTPLAMFPNLEMIIHPRWLCYWVGWDPWYIILYTGWFIGWMVPRSDRVLFCMHTLFPLFAPPQLWFSVRTFTGSFLLWWLYLKPLKKNALAFTPENINEREGFAEIFDAFYVVLFIGCYFMSALMTIDFQAFGAVF